MRILSAVMTALVMATSVVTPASAQKVLKLGHVLAPTHQFHLGLWFNSPAKPFNLGCEGTATAPIVTPFNGEQHAGIQILNTSNFPDNKGPLSHVKA